MTRAVVQHDPLESDENRPAPVRQRIAAGGDQFDGAPPRWGAHIQPAGSSCWAPRVSITTDGGDGGWTMELRRTDRAGTPGWRKGVALCGAIFTSLAVISISAISAHAGSESVVDSQVAVPIVSSSTFDATRDLTGARLATILQLPSVDWSAPADKEGPPVLTAAPGKEALLKCGSNEVEETVRVLAPTGLAYCIGVDPTSVQSMYEARSIARRLIYDRVPSATEEQILFLEVKSTTLPTSRPEYVSIQSRIDQLWNDLTPTQSNALSG